MLFFGLYILLYLSVLGLTAYDRTKELDEADLDSESRALHRFWIFDYMTFLLKFSWRLFRSLYASRLLVHYIVQPTNTTMPIPWSTILIVMIDIGEKYLYSCSE